MKKKKSKKIQTNSNLKDQKLGQTKNSAKLVLFVFGIGPIIGIIIFLYSKGFFNSRKLVCESKKTILYNVKNIEQI